MGSIALAGMTPAQERGWDVLLDLAMDHPVGWCLIGGQMVWLHALENGITPLRATEDIDVVVDVRANSKGVRQLCSWLERRGFTLDGINAHGIGHRYVNADNLGVGRVMFDVLAPDKITERIELTTTPPARTLSVPGSRSALNASEFIEVTLGPRSGHIPRPSLLAAILAKAVSTTIPTRTARDRDWADAAFLLTLLPDPITVADGLTRSGRRKLRVIEALLDENHPAWRPLGTRARLGHTALHFLLET